MRCSKSASGGAPSSETMPAKPLMRFPNSSGEIEKCCRACCVARKPRILRLKEIAGKSTATRKNILRATESKALNRRSSSHIGWHNFEQAVFHQLAQQVGQIRAQQLEVHVVFIKQLLKSNLDLRCRGCKLPHPRAGLVQTKIALRLHIQQHRFFVDKAYQHMRGHDYAVV